MAIASADTSRCLVFGELAFQASQERERFHWSHCVDLEALDLSGNNLLRVEELGLGR